MSRQFQIEAIEDLMAGPRGLAIAVSLFELLSKRDLDRNLEPDRLDPDLEVLKNGARSLIEQYLRDIIVNADRDYRHLQSYNAQVTIVAGRWDHTCDYRTQISLASMYPNGRLILLDDDHVFSNLKARDLEAQLVRPALSLSGETTDIAQSFEDIISKE